MPAPQQDLYGTTASSSVRTRQVSNVGMADIPNTRYDVVVVGAGLQGLVAAKTYLQLAPHTSLLILDSGRSIGGVWAKENVYPGLKTNNQLGTFAFTDFDIRNACPGRVHQAQHIDGDAVHDYLYKYAKKFNLIKHVRLGCTVTNAEHLSEATGGWKLTVTPKNTTGEFTDSPAGTITASRLLVCTGITSTPMPISIPGASSFTPPLLTFHDFQQSASSLLTDPKIKHVAVYGGAKSAYDAVYTFANSSTPENPKKITWIIRESGHGPNYMAYSHVQMGPLRVWLEPLVTTRLLTFFSPCIWGARDGFGYVRRLLHGTSVGQWIVKQFWNKLQSDVVTQTGLQSKGPEVEKLMPKERMLWYGSGLSVLNYEKDIHSFVQDGTVRVVRKDIEKLEGKRITFKKNGAATQKTDGEERASDDEEEDENVEVDALITTTGWRWDSNISFLPQSQHFDLGIPSTHHTPSQLSHSAALDTRADTEILCRFPMLAHGPSVGKEDLVVPSPPSDDKSSSGVSPNPPQNAHTPWRLFRGIAPPCNHPSRDLVFLGMMLSLQTVLRSEIAALWAYAYLHDELSSPLAPLTDRPDFSQTTTLPASGSDEDVISEKKKDVDSTEHTSQQAEKMQYETHLLARFGKWRYPMGYGARFPDVVFDGLPYFDLLLGDLGLRRWRKGWGWLGELVGGSYLAGDYRGLVEEWREGRRRGKEGE
ncbi:MAG: hypothetical protein Q9220_003118 [cf. Caloplaca sp. 1 TL-2023]